jgi:hypothetical protein
MGFNLTPEEIVKRLVAHAAFGNLPSEGSEGFIYGWSGDGLLDQIRRDGSDILAALSGSLGKLLARLPGKPEFHCQFGHVLDGCCHTTPIRESTTKHAR